MRHSLQTYHMYFGVTSSEAYLIIGFHLHFFVSSFLLLVCTFKWNRDSDKINVPTCIEDFKVHIETLESTISDKDFLDMDS